MKTNLITLCMMLLSITAFSQTGIGTSNPQATLDVVGKPTITTSVDGVMAPRLTGDQLAAKDAVYTAAQTSTIVYVTAPVTTSTSKTINVTAAGYYYFDGTVWKQMEGKTTSVVTPKLVLMQTPQNISYPNVISPVGWFAMGFSTSSTQGGSMIVLNDPGSWNPATRQYTAPKAGLYGIDINYFLNCGGAGTTNLNIGINVNGAIRNRDIITPSSPQSQFVGNLFTRVFLNVGDRVGVSFSGITCQQFTPAESSMTIFRYE